MKQITLQTKERKCNRQASQTCRTAIARMIVLTVLLTLSFLTALPEFSHAQCPGPSGPAPDPTLPGDAWTSTSITITVPGTSCTETVYYCYRILGAGINQVWVYNIQPGSGCNGIEPSELINAGVIAATDTTLVDHVAIIDCPNHGLQQQVSYYVGSCWAQAGPSGEYNYAPCSTDCYCATTCDVCYDVTTNNVELSNCNTTTVPPPPNDCSCTPDPGYGWLNGDCYEICP